MTLQRGKGPALLLGLLAFLVLAVLVAVSRDQLLPLLRRWTPCPEPPPPPETAYETYYTVREGDSVVKLAERFYSDANKYWWIIEANPRLKWARLQPGELIWIPATLVRGQTSGCGTVSRDPVRTRLRRRP